MTAADRFQALPKEYDHRYRNRHNLVLGPDGDVLLTDAELAVLRAAQAALAAGRPVYVCKVALATHQPTGTVGHRLNKLARLGLIPPRPRKGPSA